MEVHGRQGGDRVKSSKVGRGASPRQKEQSKHVAFEFDNNIHVRGDGLQGLGSVNLLSLIMAIHL